MNQEFVDSILQMPVLPTVFPLDVNTMCAYADTLLQEGYPAIEVLSRPLDDALAVLREVTRRPQRSKVRWGLGTMRSRQDALRAVALRPDFLVSPAFSRQVLEVAADANIPYIPAVCTFQDVQNVLDAFEERGLEVRVLKLCPIFGMTREYVAALCGCFPGISFCPTGEVTLDNYIYWKSTPGIVAPMGSGFIPESLLKGGDWEGVRVRLRLLRRLSDEVGNSGSRGQ